MEYIDHRIEDGTVLVRLEDEFDVQTVRYNLEDWNDKYRINNKGARVEEWKKDLHERYGVDLNEL